MGTLERIGLLRLFWTLQGSPSSLKYGSYYLHNQLPAWGKVRVIISAQWITSEEVTLVFMSNPKENSSQP